MNGDVARIKIAAVVFRNKRGSAGEVVNSSDISIGRHMEGLDLRYLVAASARHFFIKPGHQHIINA